MYLEISVCCWLANNLFRTEDRFESPYSFVYLVDWANNVVTQVANITVDYLLGLAYSQDTSLIYLIAMRGHFPLIYKTMLMAVDPATKEILHSTTISSWPHFCWGKVILGPHPIHAYAVLQIVQSRRSLWGMSTLCPLGITCWFSIMKNCRKTSLV